MSNSGMSPQAWIEKYSKKTPTGRVMFPVAAQAVQAIAEDSGGKSVVVYFAMNTLALSMSFDEALAWVRPKYTAEQIKRNVLTSKFGGKRIWVSHNYTLAVEEVSGGDEGPFVVLVTPMTDFKVTGTYEEHIGKVWHAQIKHLTKQALEDHDEQVAEKSTPLADYEFDDEFHDPADEDENLEKGEI